MPEETRNPAVPFPAVSTAEGISEVRRQEALLTTGALQNAILNSANFSSIATDALLRAEQCRNSVKKIDLRYEGQVVGPITLSMGVAAYPEQDADALLRAADKALYEAKNTGRDRSCVVHK